MATFTTAHGLGPYVPPPATFARFSPWYLVPFGGGQFAQHRPVFGGAYLAIEGGLLAWHLVARSQFAQAHKKNDFTGEERVRKQANLSLGLLVGAVVANVVEALVVGYVAGEAPGGGDEVSQVATP